MQRCVQSCRENWFTFGQLPAERGRRSADDVVAGDGPRHAALPRRRPRVSTGDCGGAPGYERLLEILRDPGHPEHAKSVEWVGGEFDSEAFDRDATNELLDLYDRHTRRRRRS